MPISRRPPMPPVPPKGTCKWCAELILYGKRHRKAGQHAMRRWWHPECTRKIYVACRPKHQRNIAMKKSGGVCAGCFTDVTVTGIAWEADHRLPLWSVPADLPLERRDEFWGAGNLQLLCMTCHKGKSAAEAKERATLRKVARVCEAIGSPPVNSPKTRVAKPPAARAPQTAVMNVALAA